MKIFNINQFNPCKNGLEYYESQSDFETAWNNCKRGDWMLWIANRLNVDDVLLTLAKAHCANTVRHLMKYQRSLDAIDAAIRYGNGEISRDELDKFVSATTATVTTTAYATVSVAAAIASATAAYYAAACSTYAAAAAAYYASAASAATVYPNDDNLRRSNQKQTADICRKYLTDEVLKKIK